MISDPAAAIVDMYCKELKLPGLRSAYEDIVRDAASQGHSYFAFLAACLAQEIESRRQHRLATRLALAKFPATKTLDDFDFSVVPGLPKLKVLGMADGTFIRERENVICVGNPGTGKTHIAIALGDAAIGAGYKVRFISAVALAQELLLAQQEYRLPRYLKWWGSYDLVIVDELGYLGLGTGGPLLFQFCAERYERGSLLVTTNLEFSRWTEVFGDVTLTSALLDRLTHHAQILLFQGESYRFNQSKERVKVLSEDETPQS